MSRKYLVIICLTGCLSACQYLPGRSASGEASSATTGEESEFTVAVLNESEVVSGNQPVFTDETQFVADILFEGLQLLDADRLLTPTDNNAFSRFQRALAYDPDNAIALQGIKDIASRYIELSLQASRRGLFAEASTMLENARLVDAEHPELHATWLALQEEINSGDLFFNLDNNAVTQRSESMLTELADIAYKAREMSAIVLITAPNDDNARWIFNTMREAVEGYRLRGNIELATRTSIRLRIPRS